jgi:hypothetical protein
MREAKEPEKMQLRLQKLMIGAVRGCGPGGAAWLPQLHEWNLPKCCRAGHKTNVRIQLQPDDQDCPWHFSSQGSTTWAARVTMKLSLFIAS